MLEFYVPRANGGTRVLLIALAWLLGTVDILIFIHRMKLIKSTRNDNLDDATRKVSFQIFHVDINVSFVSVNFIYLQKKGDFCLFTKVSRYFTSKSLLRKAKIFGSVYLVRSNPV